MNKTHIRTYIISLVLTIAIFGTAIFITSKISDARIKELTGIENKISVDILSLETQFDLLSKLSCEKITGDVFLSKELAEYGDRLTKTEARLGNTNKEVMQLKKEYMLLEVKDFLLAERYRETCEDKAVPILYFYDNECTDCANAGYALSHLRRQDPNVRVYSFDLGIDLGAIETLAQLYDVSRDNLPTFIINENKVEGFTTLDELKTHLPDIATSTPQ